MATVAFTEFLPEVMPHVPDCPEIMALNAIRNACIEFCNETLYWQETRAAKALTSATLPYTLEAPTDAMVSKILSAHIDGRPLGPTTMDELDNKIYQWQTLTAQDPQNYYQPNALQVALFRIPTGTVNLVLRVAYTPVRSATEVDETVYDDYLEEVAAGALARLLYIPTKPWSNPQLAEHYGKIFSSGKTNAKIAVNKAWTRKADQIQMRAF